MTPRRPTRLWLKIKYIVIGLIVLCPILFCAVAFGPLFVRIVRNAIPWPTPSAITSLTLLPLPDVAITPGPAVTPDWESGERQFTRSLNSQVEIYTNRFGLEWSSNENFSLQVSVLDGQYTNLLPAYVQQRGTTAGRDWRYGVAFPWPLQPFTGELTYTIDGTSFRVSLNTLDETATGPAVAQFLELNPNPQEGFYDGPLAQCRYHVHGQITLTSISPVVGHFQFACQFDNQEYALVSGRFWE